MEKKLEEFIHFYNHHRTHLALNKDSPVPSPILIRPSVGSGKLILLFSADSIIHTLTKA
ncbi:hypothetical protein LEP1GSC060_3588 [Leptospira weilii serovar Ranarum str. ICFT]|uniref:Integrase core domain protein n=1 Tax=Leptospira weilii serovar Ranarum str. ICFT TaxID=1218598 RepID=N1WAL5_9LEPT|nr:hypothetical protein LEP1GSC060_3588 [Leptospira weilii serovar Ranarum str. ICFT]